MALRKRGALYRFARQTSFFAVISGLFLVLGMSPSVYALQGTNYRPQSIGENWSEYENTPSAGYEVEPFGGHDETLKMGIDTSTTADPLGRLEGLQRTALHSDVLRANLYIDDAWRMTNVRVGLGVGGGDSDDAATANMRIEFVRSDGFTGWRVGSDASGWTNITNGYIPNDWNELELAINKQNGKIEAYINGIAVGSSVQTADHLSDVVISSYNFGPLGQDYNSRWANIETGHYDSISPTISFVAPTVSDAVMKGSDYISVFASDEVMLRQVGVKIYNVNGEVVRENAPLLTGADCRLDVSLVGLDDGWYRFDAYAVDGASNASQTLSRSFIIDSSAPQLTIASPSQDITGGIASVEGAVSDAHPHKYYFAVKNADGAVVAGPQQVIADTVSGWQWDTTTYPDGIYTIVLTADDVTGNHSEATKEVYIDNTAPIVTLDSFDTSLTAGGMVIFSGDINDIDAHLVLSIDGNNYPVAEVQNGKWRHAFVNGLTAGRHTVGIVATDRRGNISSINSSPFSVREVDVMGIGGGSGALSVKPFIDTTQLFQAAITSDFVQSSGTFSQEKTDILGTQPMHAASIGGVESPSVALEPTENGWKLLGILWYWWVISLGLLAGVAWYITTRWWRRPDSEALTD